MRRWRQRHEDNGRDGDGQRHDVGYSCEEDDCGSGGDDCEQRWKSVLAKRVAEVQVTIGCVLSS